VLFLAYNKDIKEEVKEKAKRYLGGEDKISVENYDSLLVHYYDNSAASQDFALSMRRVVQTDEQPIVENRDNLAWDLVIVDEAQDIDKNYMGFLNKVLKDNRVPHRDSVQLISVGDPKQNIFKYRGANPDFFQKELYDEEGRLFGLHSPGTDTLPLSTTFRFCQDLCQFVDCVCSSLFRENYKGHVSGRQRESREDQSSVEHWVLPACRKTAPVALIARLQSLRASLERDPALSKPGERLLAFLTGSKKESNVAMWRLVEHLQCQAVGIQDYVLVCDDPEAELVEGEGLPLAFIRNVHACKGKTFGAAVLFVTTKRSWIHNGNVESELLYVGLTRSKKLLLVECDDSLFLQEVIQACGVAVGDGQEETFLPAPRCSVSGKCLPAPLVRSDNARTRNAPVKPSIHEKLSKIKVETKEELLKMITSDRLVEWTKGRDCTDLSVASSEELRVVACWIRFDQAVENELSSFRDFFSSLKTSEAADAYMKLTRKGALQHLMAPRIQKQIEALSREAESLSTAHYLSAARLHQKFQYGYLSLPKSSLEDVLALDASYEKLLSEYKKLSEPQHFYDQKIGQKDWTVVENGLYIHNNGTSVVFLRAEKVSSESLSDRLLAAYACAKMNVESYTIVYISVEGSSEVCRVQGTFEKSKFRQYVDTLEKALELL
jgi:hypothetical protein